MSEPGTSWRDRLYGAALVGTARREPPEPPALPVRPPTGPAGPAGPAGTADPEQRLLELLAVADVLGRAGRSPDRVRDAAVPPAPPEVRPVAADRAVQLLELLLTQPPLPPRQRNALVAAWLELAGRAGARVPDRLLPGLLDAAAGRRAVADVLHPAAGERGRWLAGLNPDWARLAVPVETADPADPADPGGSADPARAAGAAGDRPRMLPEEEWRRLSARDRREHLAGLADGLGPADEPLLERALDDRAATVRAQAAELLDRLPGSARAARMAERLRGLATVSGTLRRTVRVDVPAGVDEAAVRDGLARPPRAGEPDRRAWLAALVRGAPLAFWTDLTGRDAAHTVAMVTDPVVRAALADAARDRGDAAWAAALVQHGADAARLLHLIPPAQQQAWLTTRLDPRRPLGEHLPVLAAVPQPWSADLGAAVLRLVGHRDAEHTGYSLADLLPTALPVELSGDVRRLHDRLPGDDRRRRMLGDVLQYQSFHATLTEAFR